jgi:hypothetical protein
MVHSSRQIIATTSQVSLPKVRLILVELVARFFSTANLLLSKTPSAHTPQRLYLKFLFDAISIVICPIDDRWGATEQRAESNPYRTVRSHDS